MIKDGKLFGKVNIIDLIIVLFIILAIAGVYLARTGKYVTSSNVNLGTKEVQFDVVIRGAKFSSDRRIFNVGDESFITIRNVPYTKLKIFNVVRNPWQIAIPDPKNPSRVIAVDDPSSPYTYNFMVTLKDDAIITPDGAVIGGNKIKIGLPVELEGADYRYSGIVSDVRIKE